MTDPTVEIWKASGSPKNPSPWRGAGLLAGSEFGSRGQRWENIYSPSHWNTGPPCLGPVCCKMVKEGPDWEEERLQGHRTHWWITKNHQEGGDEAQEPFQQSDPWAGRCSLTRGLLRLQVILHVYHQTSTPAHRLWTGLETLQRGMLIYEWTGRVQVIYISSHHSRRRKPCAGWLWLCVAGWCVPDVAELGSGRSQCPEVQWTLGCFVAFILKEGKGGTEVLQGSSSKVLPCWGQRLSQNWTFRSLFWEPWCESQLALLQAAVESWQTRGSDRSGTKSMLVSLECCSWGAPLNSCQGPFPPHNALPFCYISYGFRQWPLMSQGIFFKGNFSFKFHALRVYSDSIRG